MTSDKVLIERQRLQTPAYIWRWHEQLYPGGFTYCMHPAAYANDEYGLNSDGEPWMWYFCVTDDFGDLQPRPRDVYEEYDQVDPCLDVYWGGKPSKAVSEVTLFLMNQYSIGSRVVNWDTLRLGTLTSVQDCYFVIPTCPEDLENEIHDSVKVQWDDGEVSELIYPDQCHNIRFLT